MSSPRLSLPLDPPKIKKQPISQSCLFCRKHHQTCYWKTPQDQSCGLCLVNGQQCVGAKQLVLILFKSVIRLLYFRRGGFQQCRIHGELECESSLANWHQSNRFLRTTEHFDFVVCSELQLRTGFIQFFFLLSLIQHHPHRIRTAFTRLLHSSLARLQIHVWEVQECSGKDIWVGRVGWGEHFPLNKHLIVDRICPLTVGSCGVYWLGSYLFLTLSLYS